MKNVVSLTLASLLAFGSTQSAMAQSLSEHYDRIKKVKCQNYEMMMDRIVISRINSGYPSSIIQKTWDSVSSYSDQRTLRSITREMVQDPATAQRYIDTGTFTRDCLKWIEL